MYRDERRALVRDLGSLCNRSRSDWQANGIFGQPAWIFVDGETGAAETVLGSLGQDALAQQVEALAAT